MQLLRAALFGCLFVACIGEQMEQEQGQALLQRPAALLAKTLQAYNVEEEDEASTDDEASSESPGDVNWIQKVGRVLDKDGDSRLSHSELLAFAKNAIGHQQMVRANESMASLDLDGSESIDISELEHGLEDEFSEQKFRAADLNGDDQLNMDELNAYLHPELNTKVLSIEVAFQKSRFDSNRDGVVSLEEYVAAHELTEDPEEFSHDDTVEDFHVHDLDQSGHLDEQEIQSLVVGHELVGHSIRKTFAGVDSDGDQFIHLDHEVPHQLTSLMDCEYIEDFFFHDDVKHHMKLHDEL